MAISASFAMKNALPKSGIKKPFSLGGLQLTAHKAARFSTFQAYKDALLQGLTGGTYIFTALGTCLANGSAGPTNEYMLGGIPPEEISCRLADGGCIQHQLHMPGREQVPVLGKVIIKKRTFAHIFASLTVYDALTHAIFLELIHGARREALLPVA
jgi:hypothetical protein